MEKTITVKGTAQVRRSPDQVVLELYLETLAMDYEKAMARAGQSVQDLTDAVKGAGFDGKALKTTSFDVSTHYRSESDDQGRHRQIFDGYQVSQGLRLEFDWDQSLLSQALHGLAKSRSNPRLDIRFTIKDPEEVQEELLANAAANARRKAAILTAASGVELGELLAIHYDWSDVHLYSDTSYRMKDRMLMESVSAPNMEPADITFNDSASFVWQIR